MVVYWVWCYLVVWDVGDVNVLVYGGLVFDYELVGIGWYVFLVIVFVGVVFEDVFVISF